MIVEARNISSRYGRRWVIRGMDISIGDGITALLGPNGAGKTTLLTTLVGLRRPAQGSLLVFGVDPSRRGGREATAARIGFLPQTVSYPPGYTVRDFVTYAAWLKGLSRVHIGPAVTAALDRVNLLEWTRTKMGALSGGMLRRAGIAAATVATPALLLLDEPAAGLDPEQRIELRQTIREISRGASVLLSTHAVEDVRHVADRVLVMSDGRIAFDGSVKELEARARPAISGDTVLERGYLSVLRVT